MEAVARAGILHCQAVHANLAQGSRVVGFSDLIKECFKAKQLKERPTLPPPPILTRTHLGMGQNKTRTAGFSPWFHLPGLAPFWGYPIFHPQPFQRKRSVALERPTHRFHVVGAVLLADGEDAVPKSRATRRDRCLVGLC